MLPAGLVFPFDFGFIPGTVGEDGDPLDAIIISETEAFAGCSLDCRVIGAIKGASNRAARRNAAQRPVHCCSRGVCLVSKY